MFTDTNQGWILIAWGLKLIQFGGSSFRKGTQNKLQKWVVGACTPKLERLTMINYTQK
jgi:hypothetical protein